MASSSDSFPAGTASNSDTAKSEGNLDPPLVEVAEMTASSDTTKYEGLADIHSPLDEVATAITQLLGDLDTHMQNLEVMKKGIGEEVRALDRPSVAFKLTDLQTLIHSVLIKIRSYTRTCKDITDFVSNFEEEELQSPEEMLYFINEIKSFSSPMEEELGAIFKAIEAAMMAVREQKDAIAANEAAAQRSAYDSETMSPSTETSLNEAAHQSSPTQATPHVGADDPNAPIRTQTPHTRQQTGQSRLKCNFKSIFSLIVGNRAPVHERQHVQRAILDKCAKTLEELTDEVEHIKKEVVEKYTRNVIASLEKYEDASDEKGLTWGISKIRRVCI